MGFGFAADHDINIQSSGFSPFSYNVDRISIRYCSKSGRRQTLFKVVHNLTISSSQVKPCITLEEVKDYKCEIFRAPVQLKTAPILVFNSHDKKLPNSLDNTQMQLKKAV